MLKLKYPLNVIRTGYKMLDSMGFTREEIRAIKDERRKIIEDKISTYIIAGAQLDFYRQQIEQERERMSSVGSPVLSDMPKAPFNPMATQDRLAACIDKITQWEKKAWKLEYEINQMNKGLELLDHTQKGILKQFYGFDTTEVKTMSELEKETGYCERQLYRYKEDAIEILAFSIIGPVEQTEHTS